MNAAILLLALVCQAEPASPWDTAVRIHVVGGWVTGTDGQKHWDAWDGSGTVIGSDGATATVLTCNHIFQTQNKAPTVTVDLFDGKPEGWPQEMKVGSTHAATIIDRELASDLGLVRVSVGTRISVSRLNLDGSKLAKGQRVRIAGCGYGKPASLFDSEIVSPLFQGINGNPSYLAVLCRLAPATGRSGGGLFNKDDELIGVTGYQWPTLDRGLYAHPIAIKKFLVKNKVVSQ